MCTTFTELSCLKFLQAVLCCNGFLFLFCFYINVPAKISGFLSLSIKLFSGETLLMAVGRSHVWSRLVTCLTWKKVEVSIVLCLLKGH